MCQVASTVVLKPVFVGQLSKEAISEYLSPHVAKWWLPDDVIFVDATPKTNGEKFEKKVLHKQYEIDRAAQG